MKFQITLALIASYAVASLASTIADVEKDLQSIGAQTTALYNSINAFPDSGGSISTLWLAIHNAALGLVPIIDQGTSDINGVPKPVSKSDGNTILTGVKGIEPVILNALSRIVAKKAAFQGLLVPGVLGIVLKDLQLLNTSTFNFEAALISAAPADLVSQATAIKSSIDAAFGAAIAAYS